MQRNIVVSQTLNKIPFVYIDNFFSELETERMLKELDTMRGNFLGPEQTGAAFKNGVSLKNTMGIFLRDYFNDVEAESNIYKTTRAYFDDEFLKTVVGKAWFLRYISPEYNFYDNTQVLYYENKDTYGNHTDTAAVTILCWLHRQPKAFVGGDIVLEETVKVEMKHNRVLIFPSITRHEVTPVEMLEKKDGYGRYCVSNFVHIRT